MHQELATPGSHSAGRIEIVFVLELGGRFHAGRLQ